MIALPLYRRDSKKCAKVGRNREHNYEISYERECEDTYTNECIYICHNRYKNETHSWKQIKMRIIPIPGEGRAGGVGVCLYMCKACEVYFYEKMGYWGIGYCCLL
jgi:hypothetical protein